MINKLSLKETVTATGVALSFTLFSITPAKAASFTFFQGNWQYGGSLSGFFSGDDFNNDGSITASEVSTFSAIFEGNLLADFPLPIGPFIRFNSINFSLIPSESLPPRDLPVSLPPFQNFAFNYSTSSSELSFSLERRFCSGGLQFCLSGSLISDFIIVSSQGGNIFFSPFEARLAFPLFTTSSSSAPVVTPLQQSIPESSSLIGTLLTSLSFLLRKKSYLPSLQNK